VFEYPPSLGIARRASTDFEAWNCLLNILSTTDRPNVYVYFCSPQGGAIRDSPGHPYKKIVRRPK
jgi:hypothetical protein